MKYHKLPLEEIQEDDIVFYDLETGMEGAPYTAIKLTGVKYGFEGEAERVETPEQQKKFRYYLNDPDKIKVCFNGLNFDDIVLERHGISVNPNNLHDGFLMVKTIAPGLPSYALKYLCFHFFGDPHFAEMEMEMYQKSWGMTWDKIPMKFMKPYLAHDLQQHCDIFRFGWDIVQKKKHWNAYLLDLSQGPVVKEMTLKGQLCIDHKLCVEKISKLQFEREEIITAAEAMSEGRVTNPNSSRQMGNYLTEEGFELALTDNGEFQVRKSDLVDLRFDDPVAGCAYDIRKINGTINFFLNYEKALNHDEQSLSTGFIPPSFSISTAKTRRYTSSSLYGINFQNPNEEAKTVQKVPEGWLGVWFDSTQVENIVHIYESEDDERRRAYEADPDWSEYVWLCNRIRGTNLTKDELDSIPSERTPHWSVYKEYKTVKLMLNFGAGVGKFSDVTGIPRYTAEGLFADIHDACPAIHSLQEKVKRLMRKYGYVQDVFGHIYGGKHAYKVVAYMIQGCGTGSLPKAHMYANYKTIHKYDPPFGDKAAGYMCGTTHDENSSRLNLKLGYDILDSILTEMNFNMTKKFTPKFGGIPLRAKMYLSKTTAAKHIEVNINDKTAIKTIIEGRPCTHCDGSGKQHKTKCVKCKGIGYTLSGN